MCCVRRYELLCSDFRYRFLRRISLSRSSDSLCWSQRRSLMDWCRVWICVRQPQTHAEYKTRDASRARLSGAPHRCIVENTLQISEREKLTQMKTHVNKMMLMENAAVSALSLTGARNTEHISPILATLHWLPVKFRVEFKILLYTYKILIIRPHLILSTSYHHVRRGHVEPV